MQPDPALVAETQAWFRRVRSDLRSAQADLSVEPPILEDVVFHSQQAAEKAMKGFLTWHQCAFGKTHDLRQLGKLCVSIDPTLQPMIEAAEPLTRYAWQYRYPGDPSDPSAEEANAALKTANATVAAILERLPEVVAAADERG